MTLTFEGKSNDLLYDSTSYENGDLSHKWLDTESQEVNFVQSYPFRSDDQILKCDISPSYNEITGRDELHYDSQPVKNIVEISTVSFFTTNEDMKSFTVFIGSSKDIN